MPLYEYQCQSCGHLLEVLQKFSDAPLTECSECQGKLERLLSAPAIQFKGSGWYVTDYARNSNAGTKDAGGEKDGKAESNGSKESKDSPSSKESKDSKVSESSKGSTETTTKKSKSSDSQGS